MQWSQLKKRIEDGMADSVRGRVQIWSTRYRHAHDAEGEAWITVDGVRVQSFGTLTYYAAQGREVRQLRGESGLPDWNDRVACAAYHRAHQDADRRLAQRGVLSHWDVNRLLFDYLNTDIETILNADNPLLRALGLMDRRCGKRRLAALDPEREHPLVQTLLRVRREAEGIVARAA